MKTPEPESHHPDGVITIPFEDFDVLVRVLQSHLHRDTSVRDLLSGLEPHWLCEQKTVLIREMPVDREPETSTYEVLATGEVEVSGDEQLGIILDWIRDGGG